MITVKYRANLTEDIEQQMVFDWAEVMECRYPCLKLMYHVPNEGKRSKATGAKMKRMGLRPGVPDICLPVARGGFHGLYIEMKAVGGRATKEQCEYLERSARRATLSRSALVTRRPKRRFSGMWRCGKGEVELYEEAR